MILTRSLSVPTLAALIASLLVSGCATPGGPNQTAGADPAQATECNPALAAGLGAVVGTLLGGGTNSLRGAALGAGLGALACVAINYQSQQVKSAQQTQTDYKLANKGRLPEMATLVKYETGFTPPTVRPGQKAQTNSYIEVVPGTKDANPLIEEEMTLYKPDGTVLTTARKAVSATSNAGGFRNSFTIPMPDGVPQGVYPVKTSLYVNKKRVTGQDTKLQIVQWNGVTPTVLALAN